MCFVGLHGAVAVVTVDVAVADTLERFKMLLEAVSDTLPGCLGPAL